MIPVKSRIYKKNNNKDEDTSLENMCKSNEHVPYVHF